MKLIIQNDRIAGTATDDYSGPEQYINAPAGFDIGRMGDYVVMAGMAEIPPLADSARIAALWQAAHDYEYAEVSGSAIGLLAMGVIQSKPKCLSVQGWIKGIWTEYYARKASGSTDYSFAVVGACPYSVPELMTELGL